MTPEEKLEKIRFLLDNIPFDLAKSIREIIDLPECICDPKSVWIEVNCPVCIGNKK